MYIVMLVLDDAHRLDEVCDAWQKVGVLGATIVDSTGVNRLRVARGVASPYVTDDNRLVGRELDSHYTLFVVVPDEDTARACLAAAESVVGDLDNPNTGIFAAWPLPIVKGVHGLKSPCDT